MSEAQRATGQPYVAPPVKMRIPPQVDQASVVLLGRFNPAIFQPSWFARNGIVGSEEADNAQIEIIHPELSRFQTTNYFIQVERERFVARSKGGPIEIVKDLASKTFGDFLPHTPTAVLGINRTVHFDTGSFHTRDAVGRTWHPGTHGVTGPKALKGTTKLPTVA